MVISSSPVTPASTSMTRRSRSPTAARSHWSSVSLRGLPWREILLRCWIVRQRRDFAELAEDGASDVEAGDVSDLRVYPVGTAAHRLRALQYLAPARPQLGRCRAFPDDGGVRGREPVAFDARAVDAGCDLGEGRLGVGGR